MIYFVRAEGTQFVKIGFTSGPIEKRIASLQTGNPNRLVVELTLPWGTREHEKSLHELFVDARTTGEWFELYEEDVSSVRQGYAFGDEPDDDDSFSDLAEWLESALCQRDPERRHWKDARDALSTLAFYSRDARELIAPHGFSVARVCQRLVARAEGGDVCWDEHAKFALRVIRSSRPKAVV